MSADATTQTAFDSWEHGTRKRTESEGVDETAEDEELGEDGSESPMH